MTRSTCANLLIFALMAVTAVLAQQPPPPGGPPPGNMPPPAPASQNPGDAPAGVYVLDKRHASVIINIRHQGLSNYALRLDDVDARITYNPAKLDVSKVESTIDANSLDVGDPGISKEFAQKFLDSENHAKISFVSTALETHPGNKWALTGNLTLRGVMKPVKLDVIFDGTRPGMGPGAGKRLGFSATGLIRRADFGIAPQMPNAMLGDDVALHIEAEFVQQL